MEYLTIAVLVAVAGYVVFRQLRKTWSGDSPCAGCTKKSGGCCSESKPTDKK